MVAADTILRLILEMEIFSFPPLHQTSVPARGRVVRQAILVPAGCVALPTSPTSDAAAPDVNVPPPFALSGASLSLHA